MKAKPAMNRVRQEPDENLIRDYARHLYEQSGCVPGRDLDNWLEAERTLTAALQRSAQNRIRRDLISTHEEVSVEAMDAHHVTT